MRLLAKFGSGAVFYTRLLVWGLLYPVAAVGWVLNGFTSLVAVVFEGVRLVFGASAILLTAQPFRVLVNWQIRRYPWDALFYEHLRGKPRFEPGDDVNDHPIRATAFHRASTGRERAHLLVNDFARRALTIAQEQRDEREPLPPAAEFLVNLVKSSLGFVLTIVNVAWLILGIPVSAVNVTVSAVRVAVGKLCGFIAPSEAVQSSDNFVVTGFWWEGIYLLDRKIEDVW